MNTDYDDDFETIPLKEMFDIEFKAIREALMSVQENYACIRYLLSSDSNQQIDDAKKGVFFALCIENCAYSIYINLHKLFSDGEDYSFFKFIKIVTSGSYKALNIPVGTVKEWRKRINEQRLIIDAVGGIRNNGIAHFKKPSDTSSTRYLSFMETETLITIAQDIFKDIYNHAFASALLIDKPLNPTVDNLQRIVEWYAKYPHLLAEYQKIQLKLDGHDVNGL